MIDEGYKFNDYSINIFHGRVLARRKKTKMRSDKIFVRALISLTGVFLFLGGILANDQPTAPILEGDVVLIKLSMPDGNWIRFKAKNEELLVLSKEKENTRFELTPLFQNESDLSIKIRVLDGEAIKQYETLKVSVGSIAESSFSLPFNIEIEGIRSKTSMESSQPRPCESLPGKSVRLGANNYGSRKDSVDYKPASLLYTNSRSGQCCVTCGGLRICGCVVEASCGGCVGC